MIHAIFQALGVGLFFVTMYAALQFEGIRDGMSYARQERRLLKPKVRAPEAFD